MLIIFLWFRSEGGTDDVLVVDLVLVVLLAFLIVGDRERGWVGGV